MNALKSLLDEIFSDQNFIEATLSTPSKKNIRFIRTKIRPVKIKTETKCQVSNYSKEKAFHKNLSMEDCKDFFLEMLRSDYKQALIQTSDHDYQILINKRGVPTILKKAATKECCSVSHNRQKNYLLPEGTPIPFLIALGIMNSQGKIISGRRDKFVQLNRFLELIQDVLSHFDPSQTIHIIDFGCGKAYLTFALYHFLTTKLHFPLDIVGLDLKQEIVENCQALAERLEYRNLKFQVGDINHFVPRSPVDMVITLHACDTATDAAIEKAIQWNAKVILSVPCCQHELFSQIRSLELAPLLKHGIIKERLTALVTDAARAQLLEIAGYQVQVLEFIELEHTPKNLLIRAVKRTKPIDKERTIQSYLEFKRMLNITPSLEKRLEPFFGCDEG
jgi:SAM-dependent methyltransferase